MPLLPLGAQLPVQPPMSVPAAGPLIPDEKKSPYYPTKRGKQVYNNRVSVHGDRKVVCRHLAIGYLGRLGDREAGGFLDRDVETMASIEQYYSGVEAEDPDALSRYWRAEAEINSIVHGTHPDFNNKNLMRYAEFGGYLQRLADAVPAGDAEPARVLILTKEHALALTLEKKDEGQRICVRAYDPNVTTNHQRVEAENSAELAAVDFARLFPAWGTPAEEPLLVAYGAREVARSPADFDGIDISARLEMSIPHNDMQAIAECYRDLGRLDAPEIAEVLLAAAPTNPVGEALESGHFDAIGTLGAALKRLMRKFQGPEQEILRPALVELMKGDQRSSAPGGGLPQRDAVAKAMVLYFDALTELDILEDCYRAKGPKAAWDESDILACAVLREPDMLVGILAQIASFSLRPEHRDDATRLAGAKARLMKGALPKLRRDALLSIQNAPALMAALGQEFGPGFEADLQSLL